MKHASDIFPHALAQLIELGEKARKERETRARDTRLRDNDKTGGRETARVSRKREQLKLQFN